MKIYSLTLSTVLLQVYRVATSTSEPPTPNFPLWPPHPYKQNNTICAPVIFCLIGFAHPPKKKKTLWPLRPQEENLFLSQFCLICSANLFDQREKRFEYPISSRWGPGTPSALPRLPPFSLGCFRQPSVHKSSSV